MSIKNKALLCGINYTGTRSALRGCINDVKNVRRYLEDRFRVIHEVRLTTNRGIEEPEEKEEQVVSTEFLQRSPEVTAANETEELTLLILTDDQTERHVPTRANLLSAIDWLVRDTRPGDRRFFHYSGHGTHVRDLNGDELGGRDQALCPLDYQRAGLIIDDDLRKHLVDPLPAGSQLRAILDCCHSGSISDNKYTYSDAWALNPSVASAVTENPKVAESQADVVMFSGCEDTQTSADAYWKGAWAGALTAGFLEILRDPKQDHAYRALFHRLRTSLAAKKYTQRPQLSSGKPLSLDDQFDLF